MTKDYYLKNNSTKENRTLKTIDETPLLEIVEKQSDKEINECPFSIAK